MITCMLISDVKMASTSMQKCSYVVHSQRLVLLMLYDISDLFILNFTVVCGINGCVKSYHQFFSYKKHLYRNHPEVLKTTGTASDDPGDNVVELGCDNYDQETGLSDNSNQGETADMFSISPHGLS